MIALDRIDLSAIQIADQTRTKVEQFWRISGAYHPYHRLETLFTTGLVPSRRLLIRNWNRTDHKRDFYKGESRDRLLFFCK